MSRTNMRGVFNSMEECIAAAKKAQHELVTNYTLEDRDKFLKNIQKRYLEHVEEMSKMELVLVVWQTKLQRISVLPCAWLAPKSFSIPYWLLKRVLP
jgi:ribosomal protein S2